MTANGLLQKYNYDQLNAMTRVYFSGTANDFQKSKYALIVAELTEAIEAITGKKPQSTAATYLYSALGAAVDYQNRLEKEMLKGARANAENARTQLKNWK